MTQPAHNPPDQAPAQPTGSALRVARIVIAIGLFLGIAVFAVLTIQELKAGATAQPVATDFGAASIGTDGLPYPPPKDNSPLAGLTGTNTNLFIPIHRANPHPGEIAPFRGTAPYGQPPYRQPNAGGEVWEFCAYRIADAKLNDLLAHYAAQADRKGMRLVKQHPTTNKTPGGTAATWSDGQRALQVTAWPGPITQPVQPPLAQPTPLQWVVKYSYPKPPASP